MCAVRITKGGNLLVKPVTDSSWDLELLEIFTRFFGFMMNG